MTKRKVIEKTLTKIVIGIFLLCFIFYIIMSIYTKSWWSGFMTGYFLIVLIWNITEYYEKYIKCKE